MRGNVSISGKDVEMLANAASPILYKKVFRRDWFKTLTETQTDESGVEGISYFEEMGFIMAMQAEKTTQELLALSYDNYIEWISQFEPEDMMVAVGDIAGIYRAQENTGSEAKKLDG